MACSRSWRTGRPAVCSSSSIEQTTGSGCICRFPPATDTTSNSGAVASPGGPALANAASRHALAARPSRKSAGGRATRPRSWRSSSAVVCWSAPSLQAQGACGLALGRGRRRLADRVGEADARAQHGRCRRDCRTFADGPVSIGLDVTLLESEFEDRRALTWHVALRGLLGAVRRLADAPRGKFSGTSGGRKRPGTLSRRVTCRQKDQHK